MNKNHVSNADVRNALAAAGETRRNGVALASAKEWLARGEADPTGQEWMVGHDPTKEAVERRRDWIGRSIAHLSGPMARKAARARSARKQARYLRALGRHNSALAQAQPGPDPWDDPYDVTPR